MYTFQYKRDGQGPRDVKDSPFTILRAYDHQTASEYRTRLASQYGCTIYVVDHTPPDQRKRNHTLALTIAGRWRLQAAREFQKGRTTTAHNLIYQAKREVERARDIRTGAFRDAG